MVYSNLEHIDKFVHRHAFQRFLLQANRQDAGLLPGRESSCQVGFELLHQFGNAFGTATTMTNRLGYFNIIRLAAILEKYLDGIGDGALVRIQIVA